MRNSYSIRALSSPFIRGILVAVFFAASARSDNQTRSNWTVNISEGGLSPAPAMDDDQAEIAVVGSTVHVIWVADDPTPGGAYHTVIWYRRSLDTCSKAFPKLLCAQA